MMRAGRSKRAAERAAASLALRANALHGLVAELSPNPSLLLASASNEEPRPSEHRGDGEQTQ